MQKQYGRKTRCYTIRQRAQIKEILSGLAGLVLIILCGLGGF